MKSVRDKFNSDKIFFLIDGPSGVGKTQLPFTMHALQINVCHLMITMVSSNLQMIYSPLEQNSILFGKVLKADLTNLPEDEDLDVGTLSISPLELWTVGFLFEILGELSYTKWTVSALNSYVKRCVPSTLPIFFLDEVRADKINGRRLRFARNLLKAAGLVPVLMGTNSNAANFVDSASHSRGEPRLWCKVITRLPPVSEATLRILGARRTVDKLRSINPSLSSIVEFLEQQIHTSHPLFVEYFVRAAESLTEPESAVLFLDDAFQAMAKLAHRAKPQLRKPQGLRGQYLIHIVGHTEKQGPNEPFDGLWLEKPAYLVASHFAFLDDEDCDLYLNDKKLFKDSSQFEDSYSWAPTSHFKHPSQDAFLYLMLGGGKGDFPVPFSKDGVRYTTRQTFNHLLREAHDQGRLIRGPHHMNSVAKSRSGDALEALAAVALEIASHRGGTAGIELKDFICELATELLTCYQQLSWKAGQPDSALAVVDWRRKVPFLSPANGPWPETLGFVDGALFGDLTRAKNAQHIDLEIRTLLPPTSEARPDITGECKNYNGVIGLDVLKMILRRLNEKQSWLHLVICTKVRDTYFKSSSWAEFKATERLVEMSILKVTVQETKLSLAPLFPGSTSQTANQRVVIVFPVEDWGIGRKKTQHQSVQSLRKSVKKAQTRRVGT
jgi:hypothetical protein